MKYVQKFGFIGAGQMAQSTIEALVNKLQISPKSIFVTNKSSTKAQSLADQYGVQFVGSTDELLDQATWIFLAMKPQDFEEALTGFVKAFDENHVVLSFCAGISLEILKNYLPTAKNFVRVMPSLGTRFGIGMLPYVWSSEKRNLETTIEDVLSVLGTPVLATESETFEAAMVGCSSGLGFIYELMGIWKDWLEERGFDPELAHNMVVQTFKTAAVVAEKSTDASFEGLQNKVASKKGVTAEGLKALREMEVDRVLRVSFEKALLRDEALQDQVMQQIGRSSS